jgi:hypothetical protein
MPEFKEMSLMNANKFILTVKNRGSQFKKLAIFQTLKDVSESAVKPLPLAWIVGAVAPANKDQISSSVFTWMTAYNVSLINSYHIGDEMLQTNSVEMPIDPLGANGYAATYFGDFPLGAPGFVGSIVDVEKGFLLIQSDHKIPAAERQYGENCFLKVGFSMAGRHVSVADLHPDALYRFSLDPIYRIAIGEFYPGQIIGDSPANKSFIINFAEDGRKTIILNGDDSFEEER